jgi:hypothetical protein
MPAPPATSRRTSSTELTTKLHLLNILLPIPQQIPLPAALIDLQIKHTHPLRQRLMAPIKHPTPPLRSLDSYNMLRARHSRRRGNALPAAASGDERSVAFRERVRVLEAQCFPVRRGCEGIYRAPAGAGIGGMKGVGACC